MIVSTNIFLKKLVKCLYTLGVAVALIEYSFCDPLTNDDKAHIESLATGDWITDKLANALSNTHFITSKEMKSKTPALAHGARIVAPDLSGINAVLNQIRDAFGLDFNNNFDGCEKYTTTTSGEVHLHLGSLGKTRTSGIEIAVATKNNQWEVVDRYQVIGVCVAWGKTGPAHIYPIIQ
jgi:hypothetical protein